MGTRIFSQSSPGRSARTPLKGSRDGAGDPSAIKVAFLGLDDLPVYGAGIELPRIKRNVVSELVISGGWILVPPDRTNNSVPVDTDVTVAGFTLEFTPGMTGNLLNTLEGDISAR